MGSITERPEGGRRRRRAIGLFRLPSRNCCTDGGRPRPYSQIRECSRRDRVRSGMREFESSHSSQAFRQLTRYREKRGIGAGNSGFLRSRRRLQTPNSPFFGCQLPNVSRHLREYSRFAETMTGDLVRSALPGRPRSNARGSFEFDCIDADYADGVEGAIEGAFNEDTAKPFAVVRIVTTPRRFEEVAGGLGGPGNWFALEIGPNGSSISLPTWHAQLQPNGFPAHSRGVTRNITYLGPDGDEGHRPRSIGAAVAKQAIVPTAIISACALRASPNAARAIARVLGSVNEISTLCVRDVGQASFSSLCDKDGKALLHYDVGFPISFNGHTAPEICDLDASEKPPIILSHWDWDHLHAAFLHRHLMGCVWIVPDQKLGPGAVRLARILAKKRRLLVLQAGTMAAFPNGEVAHANGPQTNANDAGLTAWAKLASHDYPSAPAQPSQF